VLSKITCSLWCTLCTAALVWTPLLSFSHLKIVGRPLHFLVINSPSNLLYDPIFFWWTSVCLPSYQRCEYTCRTILWLASLPLSLTLLLPSHLKSSTSLLIFSHLLSSLSLIFWWYSSFSLFFYCSTFLSLVLSLILHFIFLSQFFYTDLHYFLYFSEDNILLLPPNHINLHSLPISLVNSAFWQTLSSWQDHSIIV